MKEYTSENLRDMYLNFFKERGHKVIPSASLIPENDPTVLFTTAGMHPLVPYLLGEKHPAGNRLTDVQKCVRTGDIDDVGDERHCTFFEMLGNWSLGDYFKKEMIPWSYEFLTGKDYLDIPSDKLAVTVFGGDETLPRDDEAAELWEKAVGACGPDRAVRHRHRNVRHPQAQVRAGLQSRLQVRRFPGNLERRVYALQQAGGRELYRAQTEKRRYGHGAGTSAVRAER